MCVSRRQNAKSKRETVVKVCFRCDGTRLNLTSSRSVYYPSEESQRAIRGHGASPESLSTHNPRSLPRDTDPGSVTAVFNAISLHKVISHTIVVESSVMILCVTPDPETKGFGRTERSSSLPPGFIRLCPFSHYTLQ